MHMQMPNERIRVVALACLLLAGCDKGAEVRRVPMAPSPITAPSVPPASPRAISVHEIAVGDTLEGRYTYCFPIGTTWCTRADDELHYVFTAPRDGTVVVTLTWASPAGAIFRLTLDSVVVPPRPSIWSPLTGELRVIAGSRYTIIVTLWGADEQFKDHPFVLSTALR